MFYYLAKSPLVLIVTVALLLSYAQRDVSARNFQGQEYKSALAKDVIEAVYIARKSHSHGLRQYNIRQSVLTSRAGMNLLNRGHGVNIIKNAYRQHASIVITQAPLALCMELNRYDKLYHNQQAIHQASFNFNKCLQGVINIELS